MICRWNGQSESGVAVDRHIGKAHAIRVEWLRELRVGWARVVAEQTEDGFWQFFEQAAWETFRRELPPDAALIDKANELLAELLTIEESSRRKRN